MANKEYYEVTVVATGKTIRVYKLKNGTPTEDKIWCDIEDCTTTYSTVDLTNWKKREV